MTVLRRVAVEDVAEIHVADHVRQVADQCIFRWHLVAVLMQYAHSLEEQRTVLLLMERGLHLAFLRSLHIQRKGIVAGGR